MASNNKTSLLISSQLPEFVRAEHPRFIEFLEKYYEFMEQQGNVMDVTKRLQDQLNPDLADAIFLDKMYEDFLSLLPQDTEVDKTFVLKHVKDFYRSRGSEKSIRFLFRILFGETPTFYYPKKDVMVASGGKWYVEKSLKIADTQYNNVANNFAASKLENHVIIGSMSNASATVESVNFSYDNSILVTELKISNQVGDFETGEVIHSIIPDNGVDNYVSANIFAGIVTKVDIISGGSRYAAGAPIPIVSDTGDGASIIISKVTTGNLKSIGVVYSGAGFQNGDSILITGSGFGAAANVATVQPDGYYHPNSYNIVSDVLELEANTPIGAAYQNLTMNYTNTTNLTVNTGTSVATMVNLNQWVANSNVALHLYDKLIVGSNTVTITTYSATSNVIDVYPALPANLVSNTVTLVKNYIYVNTSNLTVSTGTGSANTINLSEWTANSNVYFELYDKINVNNNIVVIQSYDAASAKINVAPALPGGMTNETMIVLKNPNANTVMLDTLGYWCYCNTGPVSTINLIAPGNGFDSVPTLDIVANTYIRSLGILGRMDIVSGGQNYAVGDEIVFENVNGYGFGSGASANVTAVDGVTGAITKVNFVSVPGEIVGGTGYNKNYLPKANVQSATGNGANVVVTSLLGDGEVLVTGTDTVGTITEVSILSRGSGYVTPPTLDLTALGDGAANLVAEVVQGVYTYPGRYINDDSHVSAYNFIQDRDYYQNFSYVIRSSRSIKEYRKVITDLVHPAGMKLFGEHLEVDNTLVNPVNVAHVVNTRINVWTTTTTVAANTELYYKYI